MPDRAHATSGTDADKVEQAIVLETGPIRISAYAFEKNRIAFEKRTQEIQSRIPTTEECSHWKQLFRARQVLIADAHANGYFERPEVLGNLNAMERYMLTQPEGPFYSSLYPAGSIDEARRQQLEKIIQREVKLEGIRFDTRAAAETALGREFPNLNREEKLQRIRDAQHNLSAEYWAGDAVWPCEPFAEAAEQILSLEPDHWFESQPPTGTQLFVYIHAASEHGDKNSNPTVGQMTFAMREFDKRRIREQRRQKVLRNAAFEWNAGIAVETIGQIQGAVTRDGKFREAGLSDLRDATLGTYVWENQRTTITVKAWLQWFNAQLARRIPETARDIGQSVGNLVLERFDLQAARVAGVDATARFVEDRLNFTRNLVLDLYEKEKLLPSLTIEESSIRSYYELHQTSFRRVLSANAERFAFPDELTAAAFIRQRSTGSSAPAPVTSSHLIVTLKEPGIDERANGFAPALVASPPGFVIGPMRELDQTVVVIRGDDCETEIRPLSAVATAIRGQLQREALDARELTLATELEKQYPVRDGTSDFPSGKMASTTGPDNP